MNGEAAGEEEWPSQSDKRQLVELDRASQCGICHAVFEAPLSLLCGHSFCSECLRSNIQYQERNSGKVVCPQCRQSADSRQVVANHALRDLVKHYSLARPLIIAALKGVAVQNPDCVRDDVPVHRASKPKLKPGNKRRRAAGKEDFEVIDLDSSPELDLSPRKLRKRGKAVQYFPKAQPEEELDDGSEDDEVGEAELGSEDESYSSASSASPKKRPRSNGGKQPAKRAPPPNWVECPCCTQHFPFVLFNEHLDKCLETGSKGDEGQSNGKASRARLAVPPKLLLAIETDKSLKNRLKKYDLSTKGSRQDLEQRYNKFRVEVQTAIDKNETAATYASLARRVMVRETNVTNAGSGGLGVKTGLAKKPGSTGGSNFDDLIKATQKRAASSRPDSATPAGDDEEGEKPRTPLPENGLEGNQTTHPPVLSARWGRRFGVQRAATPNGAAAAASEPERQAGSSDATPRTSKEAAPSVVPDTEPGMSSSPSLPAIPEAEARSRVAPPGSRLQRNSLREDSRDVIEDSEAEDSS